MNKLIEISRQLSQLTAKISAGDQDDSDLKNAKNLVLDASSIIKQGKLSSNESDVALADLLGDEGVIKFLEVTAKFRKEFEEQKRDACEFLQLTINKYPRTAKKYGVAIKNVIWTVYRLEDAAKVKAPAIAVLCELLGILSDSPEDVSLVSQLELENVAQNLVGELRQSSKISATVKLQVMKLIGLICQHFAQAVQGPTQLLRLFLDETSRENSYSKGPDMTVIAGSLYGIHGIMYAFPDIIVEKKSLKLQIYETVEEMILKGVELPRREAPRAALRLYADQGSVFSEYVFKKYKKWYEALLAWTRHQNADDHKPGYEALEKFVARMSEKIEEAATSGDRATAFDMFKHFLVSFKAILTGTNDYKDRRLAMTGIGLLSSPVKTFLNPGETGALYQLLVQHLEMTYLSGGELSYEDKAVLPVAVKSLGLILQHVDDVSSSQMSFLEKMVAMMMDNFTKLYDKKAWCGKGVLITLYAVSGKQNVLGDYIHNLVFLSLLRTLNHPVPAEVEFLRASGVQEYIPTYRDYLQFWNDLATSLHSKDPEILKFPPGVRQGIHGLICSTTMSCSIELLNKLDLSIRDAEPVKPEHGSENRSSDVPEYDEASKPSDHTVFYNLVDLLTDLLADNLEVDWFKEWLEPLTEKVIVESNRLPLVSGYYKLCGLILSMVEKMGCYKDTSSRSVVIFVHYLKSVIEKLSGFRDELLVTALQAVLSVPSAWLPVLVESMTWALQMCFTQGLSYLVLAEKAIQSLEKWSKLMSHEDFKELMSKIVIFVEPYLRSQPPLPEEEEEGLGYRVAYGKRRVDLKSTRKYQAKPSPYSAQWENLQFRILLLITECGSKVSSILVERPLEEISQKAISWDKEEHLQFRIPFPDLKPVVYFDSLLPRVVELSTLSSDRRTKLAACEVLHALFVFMIGSGSQRTSEYSEAHPFERLYRRVFPAVIDLACEPDDVVQRMFQTLVGQTVRYFAKPVSTKEGVRLTRESDTVLACILEKLESENPAVRVIAGDALREFLTWNLKQTLPRDLQKPDVIKRILKNIYALALHPSRSKRLGACIAWNSIYREFREHEVLVEMFTFELLWNFLECLAMSNSDPPMSPTTKQAVAAVQHLKRIIFEKSKLFLKLRNRTRPPPSFDDNPTLSDLVQWLFKSSGRTEVEARRATLDIFLAMIPSLKDIRNPAAFVSMWVKTHSLPELIEVIEGPKDLEIQEKSKQLSPEFLERLQAGLEVYTVFLDLSAICPGDVLLHPDSRILYRIVEFMNEVVGRASKLQASETGASLEFIRCSVTVRILTILSSLMLYSKESKFAAIFGTLLEGGTASHFLKQVIFVPDRLGFDIRNADTLKSLQDEVRTFLKRAVEKLPTSLVQDIVKIIAEESFDLKHEIDILLLNESRSPGIVDGATIVWEVIGEKISQEAKLRAEPERTYTLILEFLDTRRKEGLSLVINNRDLRRILAVMRISYVLGLNIHHFSEKLQKVHESVWLAFKTSLLSDVLSNSFCAATENVSALIDDLSKSSDDNLRLRTVVLELVKASVEVGSARTRANRALAVSSIITTQWPCLERWTNTSSGKVEFLLALLSVVGVKSEPKGKVSNQLKWVLDILTDTRIPVSTKVQTFPVLAKLGTVNDSEDLYLGKSFESFSMRNFPLRTSDVREDDLARTSFLQLFGKILSLLKDLPAVSFVCFVLEVVGKERGHLCWDQTKAALSDMISLSEEKAQTKILQAYLQLCLTSAKTVDVRRNIYELGADMLRLSTPAAFEKAVVDAVSLIVSVLEEATSGRGDQIILKTIAFDLIALVFTRLEKDTINSSVNNRYCSDRGLPLTDQKAFLKKTVDLSNKSRSENLKVLDDTIEDYRRYHCAGYNALMSIVCCTQIDEKFFHNYLFKEPANLTTSTFLENLLKDNLRLEEMDEDMDDVAMRKHFVSLRTNLLARETDSDKTVQYLTSQTVVNSSLNEDYSRFDFSTTKLREKKTEDLNAVVELDTDVLNSNECMPQLVGLLQHMKSLNVFHSTQLPPSLKEIREKLNNPRVSAIAQVFLGKLIVNASTVFEPYASEFLRPILSLINRIISELAKNCIPTCARQLVALLLGWSESVAPDPSSVVDKSLVGRIVESIIVDASKVGPKGKKLDIEMLRTIVETWQPSIELPLATLTTLLRGTEDMKLVALCALDSLLANRVPMSQLSSDIERKQFFDSVLECLKIPRKEVFTAASEVAGELLRDMEYPSGLDPLEERFVSDLKKQIIHLRREEKSKFVQLLYKIQLHDKRLTSEYVSQLLAVMGSQFGEAKVWCIEAISCGADMLTEPWQDLGGDELIGLITTREPAVQKAILRLVESIIPKLSMPNLDSLLVPVLDLELFDIASCRGQAYELLITVFEQRQELDLALKEKIRTSLLKGLTDPDERLRNRMFSFWSASSSLPDRTLLRVLDVFQVAYSPACESSFLSYGLKLILDKTKDSPDHSALIFERPLSECTFKDIPLQSAQLTMRRGTMMPLFAQTLAASSQRTFQTQRSLIPSQSLDAFANGGYVKATQGDNGRQFEPTQIEGNGFSVTLPADMSQSTLDTFILPGGVRTSQTSLGETRIGKPKIPDFRNLSSSGRHKFMPTTSERKREVRKAEEAQLRKSGRESRISLYRRYRAGELPDVQISHAALLTPLMALSQVDAGVARKFMALILDSIRKESVADFDTRASEVFTIIMNKSTGFNTQFVATLLETVICANGGIAVPADAIAKVAKLSGTEILGCLALERYLLDHKCAEAQPAKKKSRPNVTVFDKEEDAWIRLAELSRELQDLDTADGVLDEKLELPETLQAAIKAVRMNELKKSAEFFESVVEKKREEDKTASGRNESQLWEGYYFEVLKQLSDWERGEKLLPHPSDSSMWTNAEMLRRVFEVKTRIVIDRGGSKKSLLEDLNKMIKDKTKSDILKVAVPEELAVLYALQSNLPLARLHTQNRAKNLIVEWENTTLLIPEMRRTIQEGFAAVMDLERYCDVDRSLPSRLLGIWSNDVPLETDTLVHRDQITTRRYRFLTDLKAGLQRGDSEELSAVRLKVAVDHVEFSLSQKNHYMAFKVLEKASEYHEDPSYPVRLKSSYDLAYAKATVFRVTTLEPVKGLKWLMKGQDILDEISTDTLETTFIAKLFEEKAKVCCAVAKTLLRMGDSRHSLTEKETERIKHLWKVRPTWSSEKLCSTLAERGRKLMIESVQNATNSQACAEENLKLAKYCEEMLSFSNIDKDVKSELLKGQIDGTLAAMKLGSAKARDVFPSLLPLIEDDPVLCCSFAEKAMEVPSWMFLMWQNQLLSWLPTQAHDVIAPIVIRLAEDYPLALLYSYRVSRPAFSDKVSPSTLEELDKLLKPPPIYDTFLKALDNVAIPSAVGATFLKDALSKLQRDQIAAVKEAYLQFRSDVFKTQSEQKLHGVAYDLLIKDWKSKFEKVFGESGELITKTSSKKIQQLIADWEEQKKKERDLGLLKDLSVWLSGYRRTSMSESIELPGQYTGERKPMPQHHTYIDSFEPTVQVLNSLRRPVRITIIGSDARSYKFLVKFGEDIRQDERIEKLFGVTNSVLKANPATRSRGLHLKTYKVFPFSQRLGLIEWMEGVSTYKEFLAISKDVRYQRSYQAYTKLYRTYLDYIPGYEKYSRDELVPEYEAILRVGIPQNTLRARFERLSNSPEGFYRLRLSFARSHGTLSIVHWILGIGDRHTSNVMISELTGESVGIDFGYAFGVTTEFLPIPEVVPARLTPQILGLLAPVGPGGPLKASMVHALSALKENSDAFLAVLDVFVREPSLDWLEFARRAATTADSSDGLSWFPQKKVEACRKKLMHGANPSCGMIAELGKREKLDFIQEAIRGAEDSRRFNLPEEDLTITQQVECLIEQTTDYNLLGRMFAGWESYL